MEGVLKKKRDELDLKYSKLNRLIGRRSHLSVYNKLLIYKQVLKPVWSYGIQLWGCTRKSDIEIIQRFKNKVLRGIVNCPWYIRMPDLHRDLGVEYVSSEIKKVATAYQQRLRCHINPEVSSLLLADQQRRLRRTRPNDLAN